MVQGLEFRVSGFGFRSRLSQREREREPLHRVGGWWFQLQGRAYLGCGGWGAGFSARGGTRLQYHYHGGESRLK